MQGRLFALCEFELLCFALGEGGRLAPSASFRLSELPPAEVAAEVDEVVLPALSDATSSDVRLAASRSANESCARLAYSPNGVGPTAHNSSPTLRRCTLLHTTPEGATPHPVCSAAASSGRWVARLSPATPSRAQHDVPHCVTPVACRVPT